MSFQSMLVPMMMQRYRRILASSWWSAARPLLMGLPVPPSTSRSLQPEVKTGVTNRRTVRTRSSFSRAVYTTLRFRNCRNPVSQSTC